MPKLTQTRYSYVEFYNLLIFLMSTIITCIIFFSALNFLGISFVEMTFDVRFWETFSRFVFVIFEAGILIGCVGSNVDTNGVPIEKAKRTRRSRAEMNDLREKWVAAPKRVRGPNKKNDANNAFTMQKSEKTINKSWKAPHQKLKKGKPPIKVKLISAMTGLDYRIFESIQDCADFLKRSTTRVSQVRDTTLALDGYYVKTIYWKAQ